MSRIGRRSRIKWVVSVVMLFSVVTTGLSGLPVEDTAAATKSKGYFLNKNFIGSTFNVIDGGIPKKASKSAFIKFVEKKLKSGKGTANYVGAAYIIQTMRGGTDHSWPSSSDIKDWKSRVNSSTVTTEWRNYSASTNTARFFNGARDVTKYGGSGSHMSMVFYQYGKVVYVVKQACANPLGGLKGPKAVPANYDISPTVDGNKSSTDGESTVVLNPTVNNTGSATSSSAPWQLTGFNVPEGNDIPEGGTNKTDPTAHFSNGTTNLKVIAPSPKSDSFASGITSGSSFPMTLAQRTVELGDYDIGVRICFALSVSKYNNAATLSDWRHSTPYCVTVTKKPKVQILGNDLFVGKSQTSNIATSTTVKAIDDDKTITYGSWGEYALIASGTITGMASGAGYSGGAGETAVCSLLTFTNAGAPDCGDDSEVTKGHYSSSTSLPTIGSRFIVTKPSLGNDPSPINVANLSKGVYTAAGNVVLSGSATLDPGQWIVLNMPNADVRIGDEIRYSDEELDSLSDIPQLIIIANSITIDDDVSRIDAWLVAHNDSNDGVIDTCREVVDWEDLTTEKCDRKLTVNGPVIADELILQRTAGSDIDNETGAPAEVFNFRPDAYLWATAWSADAGRLQTVFSKELPPRF